MAMSLSKAHAYGNDFLYVEADGSDRLAWAKRARELCDRHTGAGADGLILYRPTAQGAEMCLFNADGSPSEVSGNGVRGLAALLCWQQRQLGREPARELTIATGAGDKRLTRLGEDGTTFTFRADMGEPAGVRQAVLDVAGEMVTAVVLRVGNPQCVVLEAALDEARYRRLGPQLACHREFPEGTNVEFVHLSGSGRVDMLIWERGVGPTLASGTGACAAAVAAIAYGGGQRVLDVSSPGGTQRVEWTSDGLALTGWAQVVWTGHWRR